MGKEGEVEVEAEAAEVQVLSEWNLSRRICLASVMRADSAVTRMVLILVKGARLLGESQLGFISSVCDDGCESTASGTAGDGESDVTLSSSEDVFATTHGCVSRFVLWSGARYWDVN
jgi:hypothetical protein